MTSAKEIYVHCDELDKIPALNKKNWLYEIELLKQELKPDTTVLQVGCMDGTRIIALLKERPDLQITGLDIDKSLLDLARQKFNKEKINATLILGDISKPLSIPKFDYVICLNNTLGYIEEEEKAIKNMKRAGKKVIISVYGEKFTDQLAQEYFSALGLKIINISNNTFYFDDFSKVKRYPRDEIIKWGGNVLKTPVGYFCVF